MAECSSASVCPICLNTARDARLLKCLHSFCKGCLDDLDIRTGHDQKIKCPVCRSTSRLPENGVSGLTRDITVAVEATSQCHTCSLENGEGIPEVNCTTCHLVFCKQHVLAHVLANCGHLVGAIPEDAASLSSRQAISSAQLCEDHGKRAGYFCQQCNTAICGDCALVGRHYGHKPIVSLMAVAEELKERVRRKTDHLRDVRLQQVQEALAAVGDVAIELPLRAERVRTEIRLSAERVHKTVEMLMQEKLAQVDDLEKFRLKSLRGQQDELERHSDSLRSAIHFSDKVMEADKETDVWSEVMLAVEKRVDELETVRVTEKPVENARLDFKNVSDETLIDKANELVGAVIPCRASATHSFVNSDTQKCFEGSPVRFTVVAKDCNDHCLATGGDSIQVEPHESPAAAGNGPKVNIVDSNNGTYNINFLDVQRGDYTFDVFVNGVKLQQRLFISCQPVTFTFDPDECHSGSVISENKLTLTHTGNFRTYSSALSSCCIWYGTWEVKVTQSYDMDIFLGVTGNTERTFWRDSFDLAYCWHGQDGYKSIVGKKRPSIRRWQKDDVLQLRLSSSEHKLYITNMRSGETDVIDGLPEQDYFAYFATRHKGDSLSLLS